MRNALCAVVLATAALLPGASPTTAAPPPPNFETIATFTVPAGGAEIGAATQDGRYLAVTASETKKVALLDISAPSAPKQVCAFDTTAIGEPTSVDIPRSGRYALVAVKDDPNPGTVVAFSLPGCTELWRVAVGIGPDSIVITPNGQQALVAIEDEEEELGDPGVCPNVRPGRVDVLDLKGNDAPSVTLVPISLAGVAGAACPNDPQPEGIAISRDSQLAYVTLQENNALATIDLRTNAVANVVGLGATTHPADVTNDGVAQVDDPFTGRREPDGIAMSHDGRWLFTADEGDTSRTGSGDATVYSGGRTMTVLSAADFRGGRGRGTLSAPAVVADTGAQIETAAAANGALPTGRARNRGPEPEGIATFRVGPRELAAVTLERSNAVIVFDVSDPRTPTTLAFIPTPAGPEGVLYVQSRKLLITTNEVAGSITIICARMGNGGCR